MVTCDFEVLIQPFRVDFCGVHHPVRAPAHGSVPLFRGGLFLFGHHCPTARSWVVLRCERLAVLITLPAWTVLPPLNSAGICWRFHAASSIARLTTISRDAPVTSAMIVFALNNQMRPYQFSMAPAPLLPIVPGTIISPKAEHNWSVTL